MAAEAAADGPRFAAGDRVECNLGRGPNDWVSGTVLHRTVPLSHGGQVVPYQVVLDDGDRRQVDMTSVRLLPENYRQIGELIFCLYFRAK